MQRYFLALAYNGTRYCGWQRQPNGITVQERIEEALLLLLRKETEIVGCGRTDTGVHAKQYFAHFDSENSLPNHFVSRLNKLLGADIAIMDCLAVADDAHARFSATSRSYEYHITFQKDPFQKETMWHIENPDRLDFEKMQAAAHLIGQYEAFAPFCKTNSDAQTMLCTITRSEWLFDEHSKKAVYYVRSNRFLRGMIRLIVGACVNIGWGKMSLEELKKGLDDQAPLKKSYSAPATGLFLTDIVYPPMSKI